MSPWIAGDVSCLATSNPGFDGSEDAQLTRSTAGVDSSNPGGGSNEDVGPKGFCD